MIYDDLDSMINLGSELEELQAKAEKALEDGSPELGHKTIEMFSELCVDYRNFQDHYSFRDVDQKNEDAIVENNMPEIDMDIDTYDVKRDSSDAAKIMAVKNEYDRIGETGDAIIDNISEIVNPDCVKRIVGEAYGFITDKEENPEKPTLSADREDIQN